MFVVDPKYQPLVRIIAPEWYKREDWMAWLNYRGPGWVPATWHRSGEPANSRSDVFVHYADGDGSDAPTAQDGVPAIPADIWEQLKGVAVAARYDECLFWISNEEEE